MILVIVAGIGVGAGLLLFLRGLFPAPLTLRALRWTRSRARQVAARLTI